MIIRFCSLFLLSFLSWASSAHDFHQRDDNNHQQITIKNGNKGEVTYLGNEALFIQVDDSKILFDPFFHHNLGIYQLVPNHLKQSIISGKPPYNDIDAIFISHAHRDHFAVDIVVEYLNKHVNTQLVGSSQAIDQVKDYLSSEQIKLNGDRLVSVDLDFKSAPWQQVIGALQVDAVRIPHAGWPSRADVENLVFRVSLGNKATIMHMGDADPDDDHYLPYKTFWQSKTTDINFPPYWFLYSAEGRDILSLIIGAKKNMGIHVPMQVPSQLKSSTFPYFTKPGQQISIN